MGDSAEDTTAWFEAVSRDDLAAVKKALEAESFDVNVTDPTGHTALHIAAQRGSSQIVDLLISKGANTNAQNITGATPLHKAALAKNNSFQMVKKLLAAKADHLIKNKAGLLPEMLSQDSRVRQLFFFDCKEEKMSVSKSKHPMLIGKKGRNLQDILNDTGVVGLVVPDAKAAEGEPVIIKYRDEATRDAARAKILQMTTSRDALSERLSDVNDDDSSCARCPLDKSKHGLVIGSKGTRLRELQEEYSVQIMVPPASSGENHIRIRGEMDDVSACIKAIYDLTKDSDNFGGRGRGRGKGKGQGRGKTTSVSLLAGSGGGGQIASRGRGGAGKNRRDRPRQNKGKGKVNSDEPAGEKLENGDNDTKPDNNPEGAE